MQSTEYWRLCQQLSIFQAIMLILGYDPENQFCYHVENDGTSEIPLGYRALKTALVNGVAQNKLKGS